MAKRWIIALGACAVALGVMVGILRQPDTGTTKSGGANAGVDLLQPIPEEVPVPDNWKLDVEELVGALDLPLSENQGAVFKSDSFVTLEDETRLERLFAELEVKGSGLVEPASVVALRTTIATTCLDLMRASLSEDHSLRAHAEAMMAAGQSMPAITRKQLVEYVLKKTGEKVSDSATDVEVYEAYNKAEGCDPSWQAIGATRSKVQIQRLTELQRSPTRRWLQEAFKNERGWKPVFEINPPVKERLEKGEQAIFAEVTLNVRRGEAWNYAVTPFVLRFWLNPETNTWQLHDAGSSNVDVMQNDATLFLF